MKTLLLVLQLVPALIEMIKAIELAIPNSGQGESKLAMIRELISVAYESVGEIWPTVEKIIGVIVKTFNELGIFKND